MTARLPPCSRVAALALALLAPLAGRAQTPASSLPSQPPPSAAVAPGPAGSAVAAREPDRASAAPEDATRAKRGPPAATPAAREDERPGAAGASAPPEQGPAPAFEESVAVVRTGRCGG
jgi:hypothetical protein